jgi:hypothetical protein
MRTNQLKNLNLNNYSEDRLITCFKNVVTNTYQQFYKQLGQGPISDSHPGWRFLLQQFDNPNTKFLKYGAMAWILSPLPQKMDEYTRYPLPTMDNTNIAFLNLPENRESWDQFLHYYLYLIGDLLLSMEKVSRCDISYYDLSSNISCYPSDLYK